MLAKFNEMSPASRIWVYQSDRELNPQEETEITVSLGNFLQQWAAHGSDLQAAPAVLHHHFMIICIDESFQMASGCSIDSSVRFVQELGQKMNINFFERTNLAFNTEDGVKMIKLNELKKHVEAGTVKPDSEFFDNTVQTKGQLDTNWLVNAGESWLKRYFKAALNV